MKFKTIKYSSENLIYFLVLLLIAFPFFTNLDMLPLRLWDEALVSLNAQEMYFDKDFIVTHSDGTPEMWNTKPPLLIWLQVLSMHLFGMNDVATRLPSAIAGYLTCLLIIWFCKKHLNNILIGLFSGLILATSAGYIVEHSVRNADYDALLVLFSTSTILFLFCYLQTEKNKYLHLTFVALILGSLTKGVSILMILPGLFIFIILFKHASKIFKNKYLYINSLFYLTIVPGYYLLRESQNPGYLEAVWLNELGGRYFEVIEGHKDKFWTYYEHIIDGGFSYYYYLVPLGILFGYNSIDNKIKQLIICLGLTSLSYFLVVSNAETKVLWYDLPLYPMMAIIVGFVTYCIYNYIKERNYIGFKQNILPIAFCYLFFITPYREIIAKVYQPYDTGDMHLIEDINYYLKNALKENKNLDGYFYLYDEYNTHITFYANTFKLKNQFIKRADKSKLIAGNKVIVNKPDYKAFIENNYSFRIIEKNQFVVVYEIIGAKIPEQKIN